MSIRQKQLFYKKAVSLGIDLSNLDVDRLDLSQPKKHKSSFKKRANEIKDKFNHVFNFPHRDGFEDYPNIDSVKFVKV